MGGKLFCCGRKTGYDLDNGIDFLRKSSIVEYVAITYITKMFLEGFDNDHWRKSVNIETILLLRIPKGHIQVQELQS